MTTPADAPLTAFPRTEAQLRRSLARAPLHVESLRRPLRRCRLEQCKGMCCYDGVYLDAEEAAVVAGLARSEATFFRDLGLRLPEQVVVTGSWEGLVAGRKTALAPWPASQVVEDFPAHFHDNACVFHLPDGRCALQVLSVARGLHPWHYKPTGCWLHPLTATYADRPGLGLDDEESDPCRLPHYPGFIAATACGRTDEQGQPAHEVLRDELDFLGQIVRRDLCTEIAGRLSLKVIPVQERAE
jgi:hypothetical protein